MNKGVKFSVPTAECLAAPAEPYHYRVLRPHRDVGYWECVCEAGGHPARHGSIQIFSQGDIAAARREQKHLGDALVKILNQGATK